MFCNMDPKVRLLNEYFRLLGLGTYHASMSTIEDVSFTLSNELWRISSVNFNYSMCSTYPFALLIPKSIRWHDWSYNGLFLGAINYSIVILITMHCAFISVMMRFSRPVHFVHVVGFQQLHGVIQVSINLRFTLNNVVCINPIRLLVVSSYNWLIVRNWGCSSTLISTTCWPHDESQKVTQATLFMLQTVTYYYYANYCCCYLYLYSGSSKPLYSMISLSRYRVYTHFWQKTYSINALIFCSNTDEKLVAALCTQFAGGQRR